ncbi:MAG: lysophospholipid acyltransferase family protein [Bacteroidetes bacterium]|jgi:putative hemolysin|nr:lysophospholipid acyltransferase family protein [Bacteroidota bacterium]
MTSKRKARINSRTRKEPKLINTAELFQHPVKRKVYSFLLKPGLEKVMGIEKLNAAYEASKVYMKTHQVTFVEAVFAVWGIEYEIPEESLTKLREHEGPLVIVCNHPFGGLEAIFLMILAHRIRPDRYKVMANFMLQIPELVDKFIFVDPFENAESKQRNMSPLREVMQYLKDGGLLGIFPAGEVASFDLKSKRVMEPEWNANISKIIQRTGAAVVPVYFHGHNSFLFQMAGVIHARLRTTLLVREFVNPRSNRIVHAMGNLIPPSKIQSFENPDTLTAYLRQKTLLLRARVDRGEKQQHIRLRHPLRRRSGRELQPVAPPVDTAILRDELARMPECVISTHRNLDVVIFDADQAPGLLMEVGRLRELTFRSVGEGTGKAIDLDKHDYYYHHLIVWDREAGKIVGGYRMGEVDTILRNQGPTGLYINSLFHVDSKLFDEIGPSLELGRSFVAQEYQRNFYSLFLLWVGIGNFIVRNPRYKNLIGPVSISDDYHVVSKNMLVNFLLEHHYHTDLKDYVQPKKPFQQKLDYEPAFYDMLNVQKLQDVHELITEVEKQDKGVPILIKHYLRMGSRILAFNVDPEFQNSLDALTLIDLTKTDPSLLTKYMGEAGYAAFMAYHGLQPPGPASADAPV